MAGLDQLAAERTQQRAGDRRHPQRTQAPKLPDRLAEQRIAGEAAQKLGVIGVDREDEAHLLDRRFALCPDHDGAALQLPRVNDLTLERAREHSVEE